MAIQVQVKQGVFRGKWLAWALLFLGVPLLFVGLVSYFHEKKRWENSNSGKAPVTPVSILILAFVGVFIAIGFIFKAMREASSDD
jgi:drug/metabolite transporter (DMT)-like permease